MDRTGTKEVENRMRTMRFRVTGDEGQAITERADQTGLTLSAYLRAAAMGHPVTSVIDVNLALELCKVNGDLGRVAGLLKLWLSEKRGQGAKPVDVENLMNDFRALKEQMREIIGRIANDS